MEELLMPTTEAPKHNMHWRRTSKKKSKKKSAKRSSLPLPSTPNTLIPTAPAPPPPLNNNNNNYLFYIINKSSLNDWSNK